MRAIIELPGRISAGKYEDFDSEQTLALVQWEDFRDCAVGKTLGQHRDPIFTPLFTQMGLSATIATIGTTAITTGMVASAIATTSITIGVLEVCR